MYNLLGLAASPLGEGKAWPLLPPALKARNTSHVKYEVRIPKDELDLQFTRYNVRFVRLGGFAAGGRQSLAAPTARAQGT